MKKAKHDRRSYHKVAHFEGGGSVGWRGLPESDNVVDRRDDPPDGHQEYAGDDGRKAHEIMRRSHDTRPLAEKWRIHNASEARRDVDAENSTLAMDAGAQDIRGMSRQPKDAPTPRRDPRGKRRRRDD